MDLKRELVEYCDSIVLVCFDELSLEKSSMALEAADLVCMDPERPVCLENKDEMLFVMHHLYSKGHSYYYTLGLCDAMHYELSEVADLYKQLAARCFLDSYVITGDKLQFSCPLMKHREVAPTHPLSKVQLSIYSMFNKKIGHKTAVDSILKDVAVLKEKYKQNCTDLCGFAASNALHMSIGYVPADVPQIGVCDALCEIEENICTVKSILESENAASHCYSSLEKIAALPVMYRSFLHAVFEKHFFSHSFMDFRPFKDAVYNNLSQSPLENYKRLRFYIKHIKMHNMLYEDDERAFEWLLGALASKSCLYTGASRKDDPGIQNMKVHSASADIIRDFCGIYGISPP